jgi:hypothetical protein
MPLAIHGPRHVAPSGKSSKPRCVAIDYTNLESTSFGALVGQGEQRL